jgi:hypothetical protein
MAQTEISDYGGNPFVKSDMRHVRGLASIDWTDDFLIDSRSCQVQRCLGTERVWFGVPFTLLLIADGTCNKFGLFVGVEDQTKIPIDVSLPVRFQCVAVDENGSVLKSSLIQTFTFSHSTITARQDYGNFDAFENTKLSDVTYMFQLPDTDDLAHVYIRVAMELLYVPSSIPRSYDSKTQTGMVGIANQGATCYLNSLLQVLFIFISIYVVIVVRCVIYLMWALFTAIYITDAISH